MPGGTAVAVEAAIGHAELRRAQAQLAKPASRIIPTRRQIQPAPVAKSGWMLVCYAAEANGDLEHDGDLSCNPFARYPTNIMATLWTAQGKM